LMLSAPLYPPPLGIITGDYSFGRGSQDFVEGVEAVAQAVNTNLLLLRGEWWENLENGLPLFEEIIGTPETAEGITTIDALISDRILSTEGVLSIESYESSGCARSTSPMFRRC
jgi:hypothetical protein